MSRFVLKKNARQKSKQAAFHPGPVLPPSGEGSPLTEHQNRDDHRSVNMQEDAKRKFFVVLSSGLCRQQHLQNPLLTH